METLSLKLLKTLQRGASRLDAQATTRLSQFVQSQQTNEGAFMDKNGNADIYYTAFGLMLSYILHIQIDTPKANLYLGKMRNEKMDLIHYSAFIRSSIVLELIQKGKINIFFQHLFSFKKNNLPQFISYPHDDPQSPYSAFMLLSLKEDMGIRIEDKQTELNALHHYAAKDGGYSNTKASDSSSTNATVAALSVVGQLQGYEPNETIIHLQNKQDQSGGFCANKYAPIPDLLSTATSLFVLSCYEIKPKFSPMDFIEAHWTDSGGFCATLIDESSDVEYTFYGLLALGT